MLTVPGLALVGGRGARRRISDRPIDLPVVFRVGALVVYRLPRADRQP